MIRFKEAFHYNAHVSCKKYFTNNNYFFKRSIASDTYDRNEVELFYKKNYEDEYKHINSNDCNFRCILPPPNVTGKLHLGHALTVTIQDVLNRFAKLQGNNIIWYPGFDHAGIATQTVIERNLWKEKQQLASNLTKEELLNYCENWKNQRVTDIEKQIKKMAPIINWNYSYYTMDNNFSHSVNSAFIDLYNKNFIYRDKRIVNWCSSLQSVISDQEVIKVSVNGGDLLTIPDLHGGNRNVKFGRLFIIKYKLIDSNEYVEVETSRPETIFADVAVAVNPNDSRYTHLLGKYLYNPLISDKKLKIVPSEKVDINFGTGMLKLTPNHSRVDYDIVCNLVNNEILDKELLKSYCIDKNGCIFAPDTQWNGMDKFEAREKIINYLTSNGILKEKTNNNYKTEIPICERSGNVIEPILKSQWFMKTNDLNNDIKDFILKGKIQILPEFHTTNLINWLSNNEPWCLSRQITWGHQIPAFKKINKNEWIVGHPNDKNIESSINNLVRDTDVLDTWFSSSIIPIVIDGWPSNKKPQQLNYIETGYDILGFWIARMLIVCYGITETLPFNKILLHGLIRDSSGRKMSKSLGNVIDPLDVIDGITLQSMIKRIHESSLSENEMKIAEDDLSKKYPNGVDGMGADVLRYTLLRHNVTALDINVNLLDLAFEGHRFCNKLWQMTNYAKKLFSIQKPETLELTNLSQHPIDQWIRSRFRKCIDEIEKNLNNNFQPHIAFNHICSFFLDDVCDTYIESTKYSVKNNNENRIKQIVSTFYVTLNVAFKMLSIFMPQISHLLHKKIIDNCQDIYQDKKFEEYKSLFNSNVTLEKIVYNMFSIVSIVRRVRTNYGIKEKTEILNGFVIINNSHHINDELKTIFQIPKELYDASLDEYVRYELPDNNMTLYIKLSPQYLKMAIDKFMVEIASLSKKKNKYEKIISTVQGNLNNSNYKANESRRQKMEERANAANIKIKSIDNKINEIEKSILEIKRKIYAIKILYLQFVVLLVYNMENYFNSKEISFGKFSEDIQNEEYSNIEGNNFVSYENAINIDSCMISDDEGINDIIRYCEGDDNLNSDFDEILKSDIKKEVPVPSNANLMANGFDNSLDSMNSLCDNYIFNGNSFDANVSQFSEYPEINNSPHLTRTVSPVLKIEDGREESTTPKPGPMRPRRNTTKRKNQYPDYIYDDGESFSSKSFSPTKRTRVAVLNTPSTRSYVPVPQEERDDAWLEKRKRNNEAVVKSRNKKKEKLEAEHRELEELRIKTKEDAQKITALEDELNQCKLEINEMKKEIVKLNHENANLKAQISHCEVFSKVNGPRFVMTTQRPSPQVRGRMELYPPSQHDHSFRRG
ncbi:Valine--tRNA ligase [Strongyloides ratti]|uniref:valine--tRNA ligase n=1 Tax=Strongyloides ratti TaxID=34506 RepID=A0A090L3B6_STRRB|nr:Valine--tRNA ligase [Strongyloides ratti]CEF61994.1 Valine--tRNA ligase [Strongyloides ratti]